MDFIKNIHLESKNIIESSKNLQSILKEKDIKINKLEIKIMNLHTLLKQEFENRQNLEDSYEKLYNEYSKQLKNSEKLENLSKLLEEHYSNDQQNSYNTEQETKQETDLNFEFNVDNYEWKFEPEYNCNDENTFCYTGDNDNTVECCEPVYPPVQFSTEQEPPLTQFSESEWMQ